MSWYWLAALAAVAFLGLVSRRGERPDSDGAGRPVALGRAGLQNAVAGDGRVPGRPRRGERHDGQGGDGGEGG